MTRFALMMWLPRKRLTPWTVLKVAGYQAAFASLKLRQQMMEKLNSLLKVGYAEFRATLIVQGVGALRFRVIWRCFFSRSILKMAQGSETFLRNTRELPRAFNFSSSHAHLAKQELSLIASTEHDFSKTRFG